MKTRHIVLLALPLALVTACGGGGQSSLPSGWQDASEVCALAFVFDQAVQAQGEGFIPERIATIPDEMVDAARKASRSSATYEQLDVLVGNFAFALENADPSAVLDLVAIEGECQQLGFGPEPPQ